jgi:acyl-CoA oxidase
MNTGRLLQEERQNSSFNVNVLTNIFHGTQETKANKIAALIIERDPILNVSRPHDKTRQENYAITMAQIKRIVEIQKSLSSDPYVKIAIERYMHAYSRQFSMRFSVHEILFHETVRTQGTNEQWSRWRDDIENWRVLGCFAMTELGHSSYLRGIETLATYDKQVDEFIIHTPTLTATKWWIGMAGQTATHTVAMCKLIINEKDHGVYWFIVPLRNCENGQLMPGVTAGDIGAKVGRHGLDNGWIQFTHVRIPRENMLMRWAQVSKDGNFTAPPNAAMSYNTLIGERIALLSMVPTSLASTVTIAVRYAAIRQQGPNDEKILDYSSHQHNLIPILAGIYGLNALSRRLIREWHENIAIQDQNPKAFLASLPDWHGMSSGLKAWIGWWGADSLEIVRRCMGGHAYSSYAGIGSVIADYGVMTTGGGDNIVMAQQSTKYLLSVSQKAMKGAKITGWSVQFMSDAERIMKKSSFNMKDLEDPQSILDSLRWLTLALLRNGMKLLAKSSQLGTDNEKAWNDNMMEVIPASRVYSFLFLLQIFAEYIDNARKENGEDPAVLILDKLWLVFAINVLLYELPLFLEYNYMNGNQVAELRKVFSMLCATIRKDVVPIVDAIAVPDFVLKSPLGRYDGEIYTNYFQTVLESPGAIGIPPYFEESIAPLTRRPLHSKL